MRFKKKATSPSELIPLLQNRGLIVESSAEAIQALTTIGYYRFSGYAYPFLADKKEHRFITGTSFNQIINHYNFDRQLRFLLGEALHHIEITIRTLISDTMSLAVSPHWFLDKSVFQPAYCTKPKGYDKLLSIIADKSGKLDKGNPVRMQNRDDFIRHYYDTYTEPEFPPSWMIAEVLTFGDWSVIYSNLGSEYKQAIAAKLKLHKHDLQSWMNSLSYLRNICAHHSRVWNRNITIQPSKKGRKHQHLFADTLKIYNCIVVLLILLKEIGYSGDWKQRLVGLVNEYGIDTRLMGFPDGWTTSGL